MMEDGSLRRYTDRRYLILGECPIISNPLRKRHIPTTHERVSNRPAGKASKQASKQLKGLSLSCLAHACLATYY